MSANKHASDRSLRSDLAKVDAHVIQPHEYDELPELTDEMMARAVFKRGGRPITANPRQQVTIRLPADVLARWKDSGPGWQTRMAEFLAKKAPKTKHAACRSISPVSAGPCNGSVARRDAKVTPRGA